MSADRMTALLFELMSGLPRQGPGDADSTRRALAAIPDLAPGSRILDLGCGTGSQTRVLLECSPASVVAVDVHAPFVEELDRYAARVGLGDRLRACVADMRTLPFAPGSFGVLWCEGAIYNVGFDAGLRDWRRLLAPAGHVVVTEVCWTTSDPPPECAEFWRQEYPSIRSVPELLRAIDAMGYDCIERFPLPQSSWWNEYYQPLLGRLDAFRERHRDEPEAHQVADAIAREIGIWREFGDSYAYQFFVMRGR